MEQPWATQFGAGTSLPVSHRVHHSFTGTFLFKNPNADADIITDLDQVHPVGVFTQLTSVFAAKNADRGFTLRSSLRLVTRRKWTGQEAKKPHTVELPVIPTLPVTPTHETEEGEKKVKEHKTFTPTSFLHKSPISIVNMKNLTTYILSPFVSVDPANTKARSPQNVFDESNKLIDYTAAVSTGPARVIPNVAVQEYQGGAGDGVRFGKMVFDEELSRLQVQELTASEMSTVDLPIYASVA
ncbi:hypothetical protein BDQ17DRAFT_1335468 [Cyathus striatus]|nr:hypothetical protein BDQ17DRAFT_1335468 [Cyathus striatus]